MSHFDTFGSEAPKDPFLAYWERTWADRGEYFQVHRERFLRSWDFLSELDLKGARVLDIGGIGPLGGYLHDHLGATIEVSVTDLRYPLDFEDGVFDLVICTEVIEHIKDKESSKIEDLERFNYSGVLQMLQEFRRILHPNGSLFVTTPNASSWTGLLKWVLEAPLLMDPAHVREFTVADLIEKCSLAGLAPRRIELFDTWRNQSTEPFERLKKVIEAMPEIDTRARGENIFGLFEPVASEASAGA